MQRLLVVYDNMSTGGTTTALLSLLSKIDYQRYSVDLLLYRNEGAFLDDIPKQVKLLNAAYRPILSSKIPMKYWKMFLFVMNGGLFASLLSYAKYRGTPKGVFRNIMMHHAVRAQVALSRSLTSAYDTAIGFIEGWSDHYVLSSKVKASKKIVWIHPDYLESYLIPEVDRKVLADAGSIVVVSEACEASMRHAFPEFSHKILVIENIISPEYISGRAAEAEIDVPEGAINLCTVCRCDMHVKGLDRMVFCLAELKKLRLLDHVKWNYVGDGKDMEKLKAMVDQYEINDYVVFWGYMNNPLTILRKMDGFVLPSRYEGKPIAVSEALCLGVPCIVTNYSSAHEQIRHGQDGLVAANSTEGLLETLRRILSKKSVLESLRQEALRGVIDNADELRKLYALLEEDNRVYFE